ncbi:uncharacterized protein CIMG_06266 [Coccidioides immitis RS]|uniref:F-box domain-containing protein n=2 Tax=Coccidioides immitis TaxID=5501 RepID=J3K7S9_COCIM|nr:uncharacterized protein CIMG_06266 [Coccidioides immitis RS]EAS30787.3 hypothetical protein CIMG_06266 [Coccidioides immitis RS]KMU84947.1 hypothetical protein CIHG_02730 [Coccidioides immitis H538.4]TPX23684.1 hypothetical protein DIZ76_013020 [Coccidioides immitis]
MAPALRSMRPARQHQAQRPVRSTRGAVVSYREISDSDPSEVEVSVPEDDDNDDDRERQIQALVRIIAREARLEHPNLRPLSRIKRSLNSTVPTKPAKKLKLEPEGVKPPWHTLPYHVLFSIFLYLSPFMRDSPLADTSQSVKCLLRLSRMCRAFCEPALSALYFLPPLHPAGKLKGLVDLLKMDPDSMSINYRDKVKHLEMDIYRAKPVLLYSLLKFTPRLRHLRLYSLGEYDRSKNITKHIPRWLFCDMPQPEALRDLRLHSWEWNGEINFPSIKSVHSHPAFTSLRSVRFYKLEHCDCGAPRELDYKNPAVQAEELVTALSLLPYLERLEFKSCDFAADLLPFLSMALTSLSVIDCDNVDSFIVEKFLSNHGYHLRELVLTQNYCLNMSFTTRLAELCPYLQVFIMDFNLSRERRLAGDVNPFDNLLLDYDPPSWPPTLQYLELQHLCRWEIQTAEILFNSLVESAHQLQDLRTLIITAIIKISWRDRAKFREHWMGTLERTFLRKSPPPSTWPTILKPTRTSQAGSSSSDSNDTRKQSFEAIPQRRSRRIAQRIALTDDMQSESVSVGKGKEPANGGFESSAKQTQGGPVHGMCDVVKVRIDNLRPVSIPQAAENLADEDSGDSDWNGVDPEFDTSYAW